MTKVDLPWVQAIRDRKGRPRHYFRRPGYPRATLPGRPGSAEFMAAYEAALGGERKPVAAERSPSGSMAALIAAYYESADFKALQPSTQGTYRNMLDRFRAEHGKKLVADLKPRHIRAILDGMSATPGYANNLRKRLRVVLQFAVERDWREDNPMLAVRRPRGAKSEGFIPWTEDEIDAYERHWPAGTRERLALYLFVYTGQRRSDVAVMGRQHKVGTNKIRVRQIKTGNWLTIPVHPKLQAELKLVPADQLSFLVTQFGQPFTAAGLTNWFVERAKLAGVADRSPHGLRKAAGRRLAEAGCTAKQIAAILGHKTLAEVALYTADAEQERLADQAMRKLRRASPGVKSERPL